MTTNYPVLPLDIFHEIFQHLAHRNPEEALQKPQSNALLACSLVCTTFANSCQPLLFEHLDFSADRSADIQKIVKLHAATTQSPHLLQYVRELSLFIKPSPEWQIWDYAVSVLWRLPRLTSLRLGHAHWCKPIHVPTAVIHSYIAQQTLQSLTLTNVLWEDTLQTLLASGSLRRLTLISQRLPKCDLSTLTNVRITELRLSYVIFDTDTIAVLSSFAGLEILSIVTCEIEGGRGQVWTPPKHLKEFVVVSEDERWLGSMEIAAGLVRWSEGKANQQGSELLNQELSHLHLEAKCDEDFDTILSLLRLSPSLNNFDLNVSIGKRHCSARILRRISDDIIAAKYPLDRLKIISDATDEFEEVQSNVLSIIEISAISGNTLQEMSLSILIPVDPAEPPTLTPWEDAFDILANRHLFGRLESVEVTFTVIEENPGGKDSGQGILWVDEIITRLENTTSKLARREESALSVRVLFGG